MPSSSKRRGPRRFKVGDQVEILTNIQTRYAGQSGVVLAFKENRWATNIDKYTVEFPDGSVQIFFDVQLKLVA